MSEKQTFYLTTPFIIPVTNCISVTLHHRGVDAMAGFKKTGYDVMFLTGTDEHGQKIEKIAQENNAPSSMWTILGR